MYKTIVRRRILSLFEAANNGNWHKIIDTLADGFVYRFIGDTPLGGTRTSRSAMKAWFERIYILVPDAKFKPQNVVVEGMPWNTQIMTYVKFQGTLPATSSLPVSPYENEVMQLMHLKWGRITSITTIEDTLRFANILPRLKEAGISAADSPPIND
jgi:ketosteroid isomerase-like protein